MVAKNKKGNLGLAMVPGLVMTLLAVLLIVFFTAKFVQNVQTIETFGGGGHAINASLAYNATVGGADAVKNVVSNMGLWGLAIGIAASIGIILGVLYFVAGKGRNGEEM